MNTGDTIEIEGLEYAVVQTKTGWCDNCAFYTFNDAEQRLNPCPRPARSMYTKGRYFYVKQQQMINIYVIVYINTNNYEH